MGFDTIKFVQHRVYLPIVLKGEEACGEYIQNGGFEDGVTPWIFGGATLRTTRQAHSGNYSAWLGGYNNADDWMYQFVTLSGSATSATLSYWWYMETDEYTHPWDYLYVKIRNINGHDLRTLEVITDGNTANVWVQSSSDISEFIGQTIQVYYRATTDGSLITDFYIDDVSLQICPGMGQPATPMPTPTPTPATEWTFSGDVTTSAPSQPIPDAGVTLYRLAASGWQGVATTMTGSDGRFRLRLSGPPDPAWFLLLVQYPLGYTPTYAQAGPHFLSAHSQIVLAGEALMPGVYGGHRFVGQWQANATPSPGTPTPPALPTPPPGTWTPPPPTSVSPPGNAHALVSVFFSELYHTY